MTDTDYAFERLLSMINAIARPDLHDAPRGELLASYYAMAVLRAAAVLESTLRERFPDADGLSDAIRLAVQAGLLRAEDGRRRRAVQLRNDIAHKGHYLVTREEALAAVAGFLAPMYKLNFGAMIRDPDFPEAERDYWRDHWSDAACEALAVSIVQGR